MATSSSSVAATSGGGEGALSSGTFTTTTLSMENCSLAAATSLCELANSVKVNKLLVLRHTFKKNYDLVW